MVFFCKISRLETNFVDNVIIVCRVGVSLRPWPIYQISSEFLFPAFNTIKSDDFLLWITIAKMCREPYSRTCQFTETYI